MSLQYVKFDGDPQMMLILIYHFQSRRNQFLLLYRLLEDNPV
ncbi:hypothetical protein HanPSC8_Chr03g0131301 [Helianthus annuus]|nr:hypothetical protein HanPSC8_Chr03g0131301 [Helianthus annuus]